MILIWLILLSGDYDEDDERKKNEDLYSSMYISIYIRTEGVEIEIKFQVVRASKRSPYSSRVIEMRGSWVANTAGER